MAGITGLTRKLAKRRLEQATQDKLVSDKERRSTEQQSLEAAKQAQAAQDLITQRTALATTGGSPLVSGALKGTAQEIGEASRQAAAKASSDAARLAAALRDKREAGAVSMGQLAKQMTQADIQAGVDSVLKVAETGAQLGKLVIG